MSRARKKIKARPTFAVVVDGETEVWYLQMLKRNESGISVSIEPRIPQKKTIDEQFKVVKSLSETYTTVFWVIDLDVVIKESREAPKGEEKPIHRGCLKLKMLKMSNLGKFENLKLHTIYEHFDQRYNN